MDGGGAAAGHRNRFGAREGSPDQETYNLPTPLNPKRPPHEEVFLGLRGVVLQRPRSGRTSRRRQLFKCERAAAHGPPMAGADWWLCTTELLAGARAQRAGLVDI